MRATLLPKFFSLWYRAKIALASLFLSASLIAQSVPDTCSLTKLIEVAVSTDKQAYSAPHALEFKPWHEVFNGNSQQYRNNHFSYWLRLPAQKIRTHGLGLHGDTLIYLGQRHENMKAYRLQNAQLREELHQPDISDAYKALLFKIDTTDVYFQIKPAAYKTKAFCPELHTSQSWQLKQIQFFQRNKIQIVAWYALVAMLSFSALIGLAHFVAIKDVTYLYFALFLMTQLVNFYSHRLEFLFLSTEYLQIITTHGNQVSSYLGHIFYFAFFSNYLNLKKYDIHLHKAMVAASVILGICFVSHFLLFYTFNRQDIALEMYYKVRNALVVFILIALIFLFRKKIPFQAFFIAGTLVVFIAATFWLWFGQSGLPEQYFRFHPGMWYYASIAAQALILQTGLSYRHKELIQDKTEAVLALMDERVRLSRDLHDHLATGLTSLELQMRSDFKADRLSDQTKEKLMNALRDKQDVLRNIIWLTKQHQVTIFEIAHKLKDYFLDSQKLPASAIIFSIDDRVGKINLNGKQGWDVFLILKEALHNTEKYASARNATVSVSEAEGVVSIQIMDDGIGFDQMAVRAGYGLKNMRARAKQLGGNMWLDTAQGKGTSILFTFPLSKSTTI